MNRMVLTINSRNPNQHFDFGFILCRPLLTLKKEAFFGDMLRGEAAKCVTLI